MRPGPFFWKLFLGNAALLVIALALSVRLMIAEFDRFHAEELAPYLYNQARTIRLLVADRFDAAHQTELDMVSKEVGSPDPDGVRVTLIAAEGAVYGDSQADFAQMESHADRPEIKQARAAGQGESTRWSHTVSHTMKYVAVRVGPAERPVGYVRVAMPVRTLAECARSFRALLGPIGIIGVLTSVGLAVGLAILWSDRIRRITGVAQSLSRGNLNVPIDVSGGDEVALLAGSLDRMRQRILAQLETIDRQRLTLESLIGQLTEGVVVANRAGRIILVNPAAARFLSFTEDFPKGFVDDPAFTMERCVPQHALQRLLLMKEAGNAADARDPRGSQPIAEARLDMPSAKGPLSLLARACDITLAELAAPSRPGRLTPGAAAEVGRLLVLTDITELTKAIRMRSDFVTNASHELRTPLAAIRAAVETLLKMNLTEEGPAATRFLGVVARHSFHLEAMVSDLLDLARVESSSARFEAVTLHLQRLLHELRGRWQESVVGKGLRWRGEVEPNCPTVHANAHLLKLVLDNLVDNAIKFTEPGGEVAVTCRREGDRCAIVVSDTGCGISPNDQERVFERFYQVAPERSGTGSLAVEQRGTGLGLSIVRHAVAALGGTVRLESEVGLGTRVIVSLPVSVPPASA